MPRGVRFAWPCCMLAKGAFLPIFSLILLTVSESGGNQSHWNDCAVLLRLIATDTLADVSHNTKLAIQEFTKFQSLHGEAPEPQKLIASSVRANSVSSKEILLKMNQRMTYTAVMVSDLPEADINHYRVYGVVKKGKSEIINFIQEFGDLIQEFKDLTNALTTPSRFPSRFSFYHKDVESPAESLSKLVTPVLENQLEWSYQASEYLIPEFFISVLLSSYNKESGSLAAQKVRSFLENLESNPDNPIVKNLSTIYLDEASFRESISGQPVPVYVAIIRQHLPNKPQ